MTDIDRITANRLQLLCDGWRPLPFPVPPDLLPDKKRARPPPDASAIRVSATQYPDATSTAIACGEVVAVIIDVADPKLAAQLEAKVLAHMGRTPMRRHGNGQIALLYRAVKPVPGRSLHFRMPDGGADVRSGPR